MLNNFKYMPVIVVSLAFSLATQADEAVDTKKTAINDLSFMLGKWSGPGWYLESDGHKVNYIDHEYMRISDDGEMLIMDVNTTLGKGTDIRSQVFVFFFDKEQQKYFFNAFSGNGGPYTLPCEMIKHETFRCERPDGKGRFTYSVQGDTLFEIGERWIEGKWQLVEKTRVKRVN